MKKIRVTIPKYMSDIIKYDSEEFKISKNYLLNYLVTNNENLDMTKTPNLEGEKEIIQFNLNKSNKDYYIELYNQSKFDTEATFIRQIIYGYISQSKVIRERFIFENLIKNIEEGIKKKKQIKIKFEKGEKIVSPYGVLYSSMEVSNYLFCYSMNDMSYKNYRLGNIKYVYILSENRAEGNEKYLERVKNEFDPFLSYGNYVTIKLNESGKIKYQRIKTNRPRLVEKSDNYWVVEGSEEKIKRYFSYFMSDVEIVEPIKLREWFREEARKIVGKYN